MPRNGEAEKRLLLEPYRCDCSNIGCTRLKVEAYRVVLMRLGCGAPDPKLSHAARRAWHSSGATMTNTFTHDKQNAPVTAARGFSGIVPAFALCISAARVQQCADGCPARCYLRIHTETFGDQRNFFHARTTCYLNARCCFGRSKNRS